MTFSELFMVMSINGIVIAARELDYTDLRTCEEKENLQRSVAQEMQERHRGKIYGTALPEFYIDGVQSAGNKRPDFEINSYLTPLELKKILEKDLN